MQKRLALVRGRSPLTRVVLLSEQSVTPTSGRLVSVAVDSAAARMPSDSAISTRFLSSVSDSRGLVAAAAVALGAQPIAVSDHRRHSARGVPLVVKLALSLTHTDANWYLGCQLSLNKPTVCGQTAIGFGDEPFAIAATVRKINRRQSSAFNGTAVAVESQRSRSI